MHDLTRAVLTHESRVHPATPLGAREAAIREQLEISPVRYHQFLNRALDDPEAEREFPMLVRRLRRLRDGRLRRRSA
ncbi:DUF3263 domain-containing protein [Aeromicrobium piscarium]|uniref:DUF3263 domain-containing protein n=1 Tax=Aeromicrobium piscarium TaxID=2590901 RepID=A0A554SP63_9ACTN|nr:DUF3263 domain-containing protein [Aeromicrobium piscarium]TSD68151.1 DUF3263 domain-containing protein [Aeromicrobium piscarium]